MIICALCAAPVGADAAAAYLLAEDLSLRTVFAPAPFTVPAGVLPLCPLCVAWLPRHNGELPDHLVARLDVGVPSVLHPMTRQQTLSEMHGWARQIAAALHGQEQS